MPSQGLQAAPCGYTADLHRVVATAHRPALTGCLCTLMWASSVRAACSMTQLPPQATQTRWGLVSTFSVSLRCVVQPQTCISGHQRQYCSHAVEGTRVLTVRRLAAARLVRMPGLWWSVVRGPTPGTDRSSLAGFHPQ